LKTEEQVYENEDIVGVQSHQSKAYRHKSKEGPNTDSTPLVNFTMNDILIDK
tara:strand:- start:60 stop:215 length:156 start_codon:yes stop_codon:yes gene_type:complete